MTVARFVIRAVCHSSPAPFGVALMRRFASLLLPLCLAAQSETPATVHPTNYGFDYLRREVMVPMRDGVKLHTVILVPNGARGAPMLLTRTPYNATDLTTHEPSAH